MKHYNARDLISIDKMLIILQALGCGSVAQFVLAKQAFGNYFSVDFGWGMGVAFGIYWAGGISGK